MCLTSLALEFVVALRAHTLRSVPLCLVALRLMYPVAPRHHKVVDSLAATLAGFAAVQIVIDLAGRHDPFGLF